MANILRPHKPNSNGRKVPIYNATVALIISRIEKARIKPKFVLVSFDAYHALIALGVNEVRKVSVIGSFNLSDKDVLLCY